MASKKMMLRVVPKSLQATLKKFDKVYGISNTRIPKVLSAGAYSIRYDAQKTAPVLYGVLRASINVFQVNKMSFGTGTNIRYSPYIEFGTGDMVDVPSGYEQFAMQFKGAGIQKVNRKASPFLIPAFDKHRPKVVAAINKLLKDAVK